MLRTARYELALPFVAGAALASTVPVGLCDDAFITLRVADNLSRGRGMVFNAGEYIYVCTSPLWCALVSAGRFVLGDTALATVVLGALVTLVLGLAVVRLGAETPFGAAAGVAGAVLLFTNPVFAFTVRSGMELPLYMAIMVVASWLTARRRFTAATACAACLPWIRFDGAVPFLATVGLALWGSRGELRERPLHVLSRFLPAVAIAGGYALFGALVFHDVVPTSVRAKALTAPALFSEHWRTGAFNVAREFGRAVIGRSAYWYTAASPAFAVPILGVLGARAVASRKDGSLVPLTLLTVSHAVAFVASGSKYATNFPWYFAPVIAATSLFAGVGAVWLLDALGARWPVVRSGLIARALVVAVLLSWVAASRSAFHKDAHAIGTIWNQRERVYATAAAWVGERLHRGDVVAANEIGTIGYFLPKDVAVLDMFGLLREKKALGEPYPELVKQQKPAYVLTRANFSYRKSIDKEVQGAYRWYPYRTLWIGVRSDLPGDARPSKRSLDALYASVRLDREYPWSASRAP